MPRLRAALALALVLALATARPAAGGCCDDFWSCAGTVATGGLSCAVELALEAVRALLASVRTERDATSSQFLAGLQATEDEMKAELARLEQQIKVAIQEIDRARDEGDKLVKEDADTIRTKLAEAKLHGTAAEGSTVKGSTAVKGTVSQSAAVRAAIGTAPAPTKAPASSRSALLQASAAEVSALTGLASDESLALLRQRLEQLKKQKDVLLAAIVKKEAELTGLEMAAATQARKALQAEFLKPIDDLLAALDGALRNPLNAPAVATAAVGLLDGAVNGFLSAVQPRADDAALAADRAVAAKTPPTGEMKKIADEAKKTLAELRKAASLHGVAERQAVVRNAGVLPTTTPPAVSITVRLRASAAFGVISRKVPPRFAAFKPDFQKLSRMPRSVNVSAYRPRLAGDFDGFFRGKPSQDAKRKLAELLAEARRRFASDPKTLSAVEKLLTDEARARGVAT